MELVVNADLFSLALFSRACFSLKLLSVLAAQAGLISRQIVVLATMARVSAVSRIVLVGLVFTGPILANLVSVCLSLRLIVSFALVSFVSVLICLDSFVFLAFFVLLVL